MSAPATAPGRTVVVLGMVTKMPVAGVLWQYAHYLLGLRRLGWDPYYVEAHGRTPSMLMRTPADDGTALASAFVDRFMRRLGMGDRWAYVSPQDGRSLGHSRAELGRLYGRAAAIINMHGGTAPTDELAATGRLVYLETDPVQLHVELSQSLAASDAFLEAHSALFTFAENHEGADCRLPRPERHAFRTTRQPVILDFWERPDAGASGLFTTIGNWRQDWRDVTFRGERYGWSKHEEFLKVLDLPQRSGRRFELALASYGDDDRALLEGHGWKVRPAAEVSGDMDTYRSYVSRSAGEFTVAKDQNVRMRSGWFSDRSATYLAAGRPVVTQDTGMGAVLPTGEGLLTFTDLDEAADAVDAVVADPARHARAAREIAREHFAHDVVLGRLLREMGLELAGRRGRRAVAPAASAVPAGLVLEPSSRRPTRLPEATVRTLLALPPTAPPAGGTARPPRASVIVPTRDNLPFLVLCLHSVLAHTAYPDIEVVVVDNGSSDGTAGHLARLAEADPRVRVLSPGENLGFARACNAGVAAARGAVLVLLNDDAAVAPEWLARLEAHLDAPGAGLVGPATNRIGNEAEVEVGYATWGGFLDEAATAAREHDGETFVLPMPAMFCVALQRSTWDAVGPLDERFEVGLLEDDDYARRVHAAGLTTAGAADVLVHHFGETSFGKLVPTGEYARIAEANRRRFEEKWGEPWQPYGRRLGPRYAGLQDRLRDRVAAVVPEGADVLVVSRGDDALLALGARRARHFPQDGAGGYAGHHPASSAEARAQLDALRAGGAAFLVVPATCGWWLDHYAELRQHLDAAHRRVLDEPDTAVVFALQTPQGAAAVAAGGEVAA